MPTPRTSDGQLSLGIYLPITGEGAALGNPMVEAAKTAVEEINQTGGILGKPVRVEVLDEAAALGPDQLLTDGIDAIIGPASSRVALSHLSKAVDAENGAVVCSPSATALALDRFPDNGLFFRTVPSDSLQMAMLARLVRQTGLSKIAVAYLDDPYGRDLKSAFLSEATSSSLAVISSVGFSGDEENLVPLATRIANAQPEVIVVLGDADDGSRFLGALDQATQSSSRRPRVLVNDSIRARRQVLANLSPAFRRALTGVAPSATTGEETDGLFTAHAVDCVNLIALAALVTGSDDPGTIASAIPSVADDGRRCTGFIDCLGDNEAGLNIDYDGLSGPVGLRNSTGDPRQAYFDTFNFDDQGNEINTSRVLFTDTVDRAEARGL